MSDDRVPLRKKSGEAGMIESHCSGCGMFIAASASLQLLRIAEERHHCPPPSTLDGGADFFRTMKPGEPAYLPAESDMVLDLPPDDKVGRLLRELASKEPQLDAWLKSSDTHAVWFRKDPVAAIRAANLGIEEEVLKDLESVAASIALKLKPRV